MRSRLISVAAFAVGAALAAALLAGGLYARAHRWAAS